MDRDEAPRVRVPRIVLVDKYGSNADAATWAHWSDVEVLPWTDIREVPRTSGTAFVSPANSLGDMDGGIDFVLNEMFPGVEGAVKAAIEAHGLRTARGRPFLPVGCAVVVSTHIPDVFLISAPTMWTPQDVRGTHNAYHAMYSVLEAVVNHPQHIDRVVMSGLCTGCGMLAPRIAIHQMKRAYSDFRDGRRPAWLLESIATEQPKTSENTEFAEAELGLFDNQDVIS